MLWNLRERVVTLSAEEGVSFDSNLLRKRFFYTLFTGFKNDTIRLELQNILKSGTISDEVGVKEIICENLNSYQNLNNLSNKETSEKGKENPILIEINKLSVKVSELAAVNDEIQELKKQIKDNQNSKFLSQNSDTNFRSQHRSRLFRCPNYERTNQSYCNHCFSCGGTDHRKYDCQKYKITCECCT